MSPPPTSNLTMGEYSVPISIKEEAERNLLAPNLLYLIYKELDKTHKRDDLEKMFAYLMVRTAYLPNPRDRKSIALLGDSSVGKDNLMDTILKNTPFPDVQKLTNATQATVEEDLLDKKIIAFSEVNKFRQNGANQDLTEQLKQIAEGGISSLKKDAATGYKTTKRIVGKQTSTIYGTTEDKKDEELSTRFATITIRADPEKIQVVNNDTLANSADPNAIAKDYEMTEFNWLAVAHLLLAPLEIVLPYNSELALDSGKYFDTTNPRSQRDLKRLVCLAKAIAWLYQKQRPIIDIRGQKMVIASPADFVNALEIGGAFFDISYLGIDARAKRLFDYLKEKHPGEKVSKRDLRAELGISRNTLTRRLEALEEVGLVVLEPQGVGKDTLVLPAQNLPNTWSKPAQKKEILDKLVLFDVKKWLIRYEQNEQVLSGFCAPIEHLLYDVKTNTCSKSLGDIYGEAQNAQNRLDRVVSPPIFERVRFEQVISAWKGADKQVYGPFEPGQDADLPACEAEALIKKGMAQPAQGGLAHV